MRLGGGGIWVVFVFSVYIRWIHIPVDTAAALFRNADVLKYSHKGAACLVFWRRPAQFDGALVARLQVQTPQPLLADLHCLHADERALRRLRRMEELALSLNDRALRSLRLVHDDPLLGLAHDPSLHGPLLWGHLARGRLRVRICAEPEPLRPRGGLVASSSPGAEHGDFAIGNARRNLGQKRGPSSWNRYDGFKTM